MSTYIRTILSLKNFLVFFKNISFALFQPLLYLSFFSSFFLSPFQNLFSLFSKISLSKNLPKNLLFNVSTKSPRFSQPFLRFLYQVFFKHRQSFYLQVRLVFLFRPLDYGSLKQILPVIL